MIFVKNKIYRRQENFWNHCLFHPAEAAETPRGRQILDRMAEDGAVQMVCIHVMLGDAAYEDEKGNIAYDFQIVDRRIDHLAEEGYALLLTYDLTSECVAENRNDCFRAGEGETEFEGKRGHSSVPLSYDLWEEICYEYTRHMVERYGEERVSAWRAQCFNAAADSARSMPDAAEYCRRYDAFVRGVERASRRVRLGSLAPIGRKEFLGEFLSHVKERNVRLDFISVRNSGKRELDGMGDGPQGFSMTGWLEAQQGYVDLIADCGLSQRELIVDGWNMFPGDSRDGEECRLPIDRETEAFSAYFVRLIHKIIERGWNLSGLMICLSSRTEQAGEFSGSGNFFTRNLFPKPVYSAFVLASKLYDGLVETECDCDNVYAIATRDADGRYALLLTYCSENFGEDLPRIDQWVVFHEDIQGKMFRVYRIDKNTTNPYRLFVRRGMDLLGDEEIALLREEGRIRPAYDYVAEQGGDVGITLTPNAVYLITVG